MMDRFFKKKDGLWVLDAKNVDKAKFFSVEEIPHETEKSMRMYKCFIDKGSTGFRLYASIKNKIYGIFSWRDISMVSEFSGMNFWGVTKEGNHPLMATMRKSDSYIEISYCLESEVTGGVWKGYYRKDDKEDFHYAIFRKKNGRLMVMARGYGNVIDRNFTLKLGNTSPGFSDFLDMGEGCVYMIEEDYWKKGFYTIKSYIEPFIINDDKNSVKMKMRKIEDAMIPFHINDVGKKEMVPIIPVYFDHKIKGPGVSITRISWNIYHEDDYFTVCLSLRTS